MTIKLADLEASTQEKIEKDSEFQSSLANLSDEEKTVKVSERKQADIDAELDRMSKGAQNYDSQRIRAEKAEKEAKELKDKLGALSPKGESAETTLSPKDYLSLTEQKVSSEDFDEVMSWANYRKVSVSEALKDKTLQTILREKSEQRATDAATAAKGRRGVESAPQGQELLKKALQGQVPETPEGIAELVEAEQKAKLAKVKK